jgi:hypothetical protein
MLTPLSFFLLFFTNATRVACSLLNTFYNPFFFELRKDPSGGPNQCFCCQTCDLMYSRGSSVFKALIPATKRPTVMPTQVLKAEAHSCMFVQEWV